MEIISGIFNAILIGLSVWLYIANRRESKKLMNKAASWVYQLRGIHANALILKDKHEGESMARQVNSTLADVEDYCRTFKSYVENENLQKEHQKKMNQ